MLRRNKVYKWFAGQDKWVKNIYLVSGSLVLIVLVTVLAIRINLFNLFGGLPALEELERPQDELASVLYSADGVVLGKYYEFNRNPVEYEELPPVLLNALIATEDRRFYRHSGIDLIGTARAFMNFFILQRNREGGSTITQQLAKNLWETRSEKYNGLLSSIPLLNTIISKIKEWLVAIQIEKSYSKQEILRMYFNTMPFGNNTFGIKVAAATYFNKEPSELNAAEAALLVGLVNGPSLFNPVRNPERSLKRRNWVLHQMNHNHYLSDAKYDSMSNSGLNLKFRQNKVFEGQAPYFRARLKQQLSPWASDNGLDLDRDGLRIFTTLDSRVQGYAEMAVKDHLQYLQSVFFEHWSGRNPWTDENFQEIQNYPEKVWRNTTHYQKLVNKYGEDSDSISIIANRPVRMNVFSWNGNLDTLLSPIDSIRYYKHFLHTGLLAMDPNNGQVKAWVGGIDFNHFKYDHVNQGKNQPGSTFKPIVYATAIENGYEPCSQLKDAPYTFRTNQNPPLWSPRNATSRFNGTTMTLRQAMGRSINRITAYLMDKLGPENVVEMARRLGIESKLDPVLSLSLGTSDVSVLEITGAYSAFANQGTWIEPHSVLRIEDRFGNILFKKTPERREALSDQNAFLMLYMLRGTVEEPGGTANGIDWSLRENNEIGAKTGTTSDYADGWFMGVTQDLVTGIWVGGDDRAIRFRSFEYGQGSRMAMPVWEDFMSRVYNDTTLQIEKRPFNRPSGPITVNLNCISNPEQTVEEEETEKEEVFDVDVF